MNVSLETATRFESFPLPEARPARPTWSRLTFSWPRMLKWYVVFHGIWILLYALLGKGFAYAGWPPLYAGEILLVSSVVALVACRRTSLLLRDPIGIAMFAFLGWQALCAYPYFEVYGFDTMRDSALWGYAVFACTAAVLTLRLPQFPDVVLAAYRRFCALFLVLGPATCLASMYLRESLPHWPGTSVSIPYVKVGDFQVHLAGIFAFVILGFAKGRRWWICVLLLEAIIGISGRGGLLALVLAATFAIFLRPQLKVLAPLLAFTALLAVSMVAFDIRIGVPGSTREVSVAQLSGNLESLVGPSSMGNLEGTKQWRLSWWHKIWEYTFDGPFFWFGKGYGVNLANADGFQVGTWDEPLRSPHGVHFTFLARSGVPGFALWVILQSVWTVYMVQAYLRARRSRMYKWAGLFSWILAYWIAFVVCASFDVFLEGPMAGIPFWTLFGFGWGTHMLFNNRMKAARVLL